MVLAVYIQLSLPLSTPSAVRATKLRIPSCVKYIQAKWQPSLCKHLLDIYSSKKKGNQNILQNHMGVSENGGTPKSSIYSK